MNNLKLKAIKCEIVENFELIDVPINVTKFILKSDFSLQLLMYLDWVILKKDDVRLVSEHCQKIKKWFSDKVKDGFEIIWYTNESL